MAITLRNRMKTLGSTTGVEASVNAALDEIEAVFNRVGVVRGNVRNATADYFRTDGTNLYLETSDGRTFSISMTEV